MVSVAMSSDLPLRLTYDLPPASEELLLAPDAGPGAGGCLTFYLAPVAETEEELAAAAAAAAAAEDKAAAEAAPAGDFD
jgi:hypothetical protein